MPITYEEMKEYYKAINSYESIKALMIMRPEDIDKVLSEKFKDTEKEKAKSATEKDLNDISNDLNAILKEYHNNKDTNLAWYETVGFNKLSDIQKKILDIETHNKAKINSSDLKSWFDKVKMVIKDVEEVWDKKTNLAERKKALEELKYERIVTVGQFIDELTRFEERIEAEEKK